jgi:hypothetical protein
VGRHSDEEFYPRRERLKYSAAINESNCKFKFKNPPECIISVCCFFFNVKGKAVSVTGQGSS